MRWPRREAGEPHPGCRPAFHDAGPLLARGRRTFRPRLGVLLSFHLAHTALRRPCEPPRLALCSRPRYGRPPARGTQAAGNRRTVQQPRTRRHRRRAGNRQAYLSAQGAQRRPNSGLQALSGVYLRRSLSTTSQHLCHLQRSGRWLATRILLLPDRLYRTEDNTEHRRVAGSHTATGG